MKASADIKPVSEMSTKFRVVMEDYDEAVFQSCDGLESEIEVVYHNEGGRGLGARAVRGAPKTNKLVFSKGTMASKGKKKSLADWYQDVTDYSKPLKKQMLTIQLLDVNKQPVRSWQVREAWPCRWTGPLLSRDSSELSVEYITFAHEGISF